MKDRDVTVVVAQHLDDVDIQGWRERLEEVRERLAIAKADDPILRDEGSSCTWRTTHRTIVVDHDARRGLSILSERQAFRSAFTIRISPCEDLIGFSAHDGAAVRAALDRLDAMLEQAIPDEGDEKHPSETWGALSRGLDELAGDLLCRIADSFERNTPDGVEMLKDRPSTLRTGHPWGDPGITVRIGDDDLDLLGPGAIRMIASMMRSVTRISSPDRRTLLAGPAVIERAPWRDPGPVARMRGIARFEPRP